MENGNKEKEIQPGSTSDQDSFKEILSFIEKTDLEFVQVEKEGKKFSFKRSSVAIPPSKAELLALEKASEPEAPKFFSIRSPIVGRFYSSMGADRPPLVVEGSRVTAGQKVAIVEAMKIKKEVFSAVTGKVVRLSVRDGDPVEYGQELFSVQPEEPGEAS